MKLGSFEALLCVSGMSRQIYLEISWRKILDESVNPYWAPGQVQISVQISLNSISAGLALTEVLIRIGPCYIDMRLMSWVEWFMVLSTFMLVVTQGEREVCPVWHDLLLVSIELQKINHLSYRLHVTKNWFTDNPI